MPIYFLKSEYIATIPIYRHELQHSQDQEDVKPLGEDLNLKDLMQLML